MQWLIDICVERIWDELWNDRLTDIKVIDGVQYAQNSTGIAEAIFELPDTGGVVFCPPAEYLFTQDGVENYCLLVNKPVQLKGAGPGWRLGPSDTQVTKFKLADGTDIRMMLWHDAVSTYMYAAGIQHIEFDGNKDNCEIFPPNDFIKFEGCGGVLIDYCRFSQVCCGSSNAALTFDVNCSRSWIQHCHFTNDCNNYAIINYGYRCWISENYFKDLHYGVRFWDAGDITHEAGWVLNNSFGSIAWDGIRCTGTTTGVRIAGNHFANVDWNGASGVIRLDDSVNNIYIEHNQLLSVTLGVPAWGVRFKNAAIDHVYCSYNDFHLAAIPYGVLGNANGLIIDQAADGSWKMICTTEDLQIVDAGTAGATQQAWTKVKVNGVVGYWHVHAGK
jgi:hypothetical protein